MVCVLEAASYLLSQNEEGREGKGSRNGTLGAPYIHTWVEIHSGEGKFWDFDPKRLHITPLAIIDVAQQMVGHQALHTRVIQGHFCWVIYPCPDPSPSTWIQEHT